MGDPLPNDLYLQPDAPDPVLADAVVLSLVRWHMPNAHVLMGVDESGGEARSYLLDDRLILKTQRPHRLRPRTSLAKEATFLGHLAAFPAIPLPRVLGYGHAEGVEYLCMTGIYLAALSRDENPNGDALATFFGFDTLNYDNPIPPPTRYCEECKQPFAFIQREERLRLYCWQKCSRAAQRRKMEERAAEQSEPPFYFTRGE